MRVSVAGASRLEGTISVPGDKSISHRAAIFNAVASGSARVTNYSPGADCRSTLKCLRDLGVSIEPESGPDGHAQSNATLIVHGVGEQGLHEPQDVLNAGNSGTTTRLLTGLLAAQAFYSVITGDASLRSRPMGRIVEPLVRMGARISGRKGGSLAPLAISGGNLNGIEYTLPVASAQVKSCLLLAGLFARGETVIHQPARSRDHSERMLRAMGGRVDEDGLALHIAPGQLAARDVEVPGDISSAAFWLVLGVAHPDAFIRVKGVGLNPTRSGILDVLQAMGGCVKVEDQRTVAGEPVGDVVVRSSALSAVHVGGDMIPRMIDEVPALAVAACFAKGTTEIRDAAELRVKESDRVRTTAQELGRLGARIEELPDGLRIHGVGGLIGNGCRSHGDHRLAMALGVAGVLARGETQIDGAQAASVSYPSYWNDLNNLVSACEKERYNQTAHGESRQVGIEP